jgi:hypothetical protein
MLIAGVQIGFVLFVFAVPYVLLALATRVQRARAEAVGYQIVVTDAIHRELGAVVAPVVTRRGRNAWEIAMAAPLDRPATVARILAIAHHTLTAETAAPTCEVSFVLTPLAAAR